MMKQLYEYRESYHAWVRTALVAAAVLAVALSWQEANWQFDEYGVAFVLLLACGLVWMLTPRPRLRVFRDQVRIAKWLNWPIWYRVANPSIVSMEPVADNPFGAYRQSWLAILTGRYGWPRESPWHGWVPCFDWPGNSAIAIETTHKKYLVSCPKPEEVAERLREITGIGEPN